MKDLILVRGVPGAGKSSIAEIINLNPDTYIIATDDYFNDRDGNYNFDGSKLIENHAKCRDAVEFAMNDDYYKVIIVHNTFTEKWEMDNYFIIAEEYGWTVHTIVVENRHDSKSIHDVPDHSINAQKERFEVVL